jgi:hypothetical protein
MAFWFRHRVQIASARVVVDRHQRLLSASIAVGEYRNPGGILVLVGISA